jgi:hypothetical protein
MSAQRIGGVLALTLLSLLFALTPRTHYTAPPAAGDDDEGNASAGLPMTPPNDGIEAGFTARSYMPGQAATLRLEGHATAVRIAVFRAGSGGDGAMQGRQMTPERTVRVSPSIQVALGDWPSGLYYERVVTPGRGTWVAPFVLRPSHVGRTRVAVVLPTNTWQAYNDQNSGSWYFNSSVTHVDLARPFLDAGVPPHYHGYDRGFMRWLVLHHVKTDFLSDEDLERLSGDELARSYDLIIFPGHNEYVTTREYDNTVRYRNLGGNLAFLSSNDFFYKVETNGNTMTGRWRWRDLGRPEASLVGEQYVDWNHDRYPNKAYRITSANRAPWLFRDTGLREGSSFGVYGIEIDARAPSSPAGTEVLATIPNIFGVGKTAEMTYYSTPAGAKVFSAGVMNFGGSALWPQVRTTIDNLITYLRQP